MTDKIYIINNEGEEVDAFEFLDTLIKESVDSEKEPNDE